MAATPAMDPATLRRDGDALVFTGALVRAAVPSLWRAAQAQRGGVRVFDLQAVPRVDSAGLALLAELADDATEVRGSPAGLAELQAAYRLGPALGFAG